MSKDQFFMQSLEIMVPNGHTSLDVLRLDFEMPTALKGNPRAFEAFIADLIIDRGLLSNVASVRYVFRDYAAVRDASGKAIAVIKNADSPFNIDAFESIYDFTA